MLCFIDIYNKYAWVIPLKDKEGITITRAFQKILDKSKRRIAKSKGRTHLLFYKQHLFSTKPQCYLTFS